MFFSKETELAQKALGNNDDVIHNFLQAFNNYEVPEGAVPAVGLNTTKGVKYYVVNAREMSQAEVESHMKNMMATR